MQRPRKIWFYCYWENDPQFARVVAIVAAVVIIRRCTHRLGYKYVEAADRTALLELFLEFNNGTALDATHMQMANLDYVARELNMLLRRTYHGHHLGMGRPRFEAWKKRAENAEKYKGDADTCLLDVLGSRFSWSTESWVPGVGGPVTDLRFYL